jgi:hypothetical protein
MLGTRSDGVFPYCDVTLEQDVGIEDVTLSVPGRDGSSSSPRSDGGLSSCNQGVTLEQESQPVIKSPASLSTWLSNMPTPQRDVYLSAIWSDHNNIKSVNNVTETSSLCRSLSFVSPHANTAPLSVNAFHKYKLNYNSGRHHLKGKDLSKFDIRKAAKIASYWETNKLIDAFMKTGNPEKFLTHKTIIEDTKSVLQHVKFPLKNKKKF